MRARPSTWLVFFALIAFAPLGCSISESVSKSISSPFESSGSSSRSSAGRGAAYQDDVRDYTEAYVRSSQNLAQFETGIGSLAEKHGISNWEADSNTWVGIGRGLRKAGINATQLDVYKTNLSKGDAERARYIQQGYDAEE